MYASSTRFSMIHPSWASPGRQLPPCRTWVNRIPGPHPALLTLPRRRGGKFTGVKRLRSLDALERRDRGHEGGGMGATRRRKAKHEGAALTELAELELERAAVPLRELAADEEPQPRARLRAEAGIIDAEEALEDLVLLLARDADTAVFDDQRGAAVADDRKLDPGPSGAVGRRVVDQVVDDARQLLAVGGDRDRLIRLAVHDLCPKQPGTSLGAPHRLASHLAQIERLRIRRDGATFDARRGQQVVDDAVQLGRLAHQHAQRLLGLMRRDAPVLQHRQVTRDNGERSPKLVRGHAEEGALALARLLRLGEEDLRLLEELLGAHVGLDGVEDDPDAVGQLIEEVEMRVTEWRNRGQLDHRLDATFEEYRQHHDAARRRFAQARVDANVPGWHGRQQDAARVAGALADEPLSPAEGLARGFTRADGVAGGHAKHRLVALAGFDDVERAVLRRDQRRGLGQDEVGDGAQIPLALQHRRVLRDVRLEPVLFHVLLGRLL